MEGMERGRGRIRVLGLVPYPLNTAPGQRYRIEQWAPYLAEAGIDIHFEPFVGERVAELLYSPDLYAMKAWHLARASFTRIASVRRSGTFDAVYLHREAALIGPAWLERLVRRRNPRILYDFDDPIWLPYVSPRNRYFSYLKMPGKTAAICRMASAVTVGNDVLAEFARTYSRAVTVVPSTVSLKHYQPGPPEPLQAIPVIGWTGSHSSARYLRLVEGALQTLAQRRRFRLLLIGIEGYRLEGVDVVCRPWRADTEVEDLWSIDVGIMPLFDDPWARGKCAMKAIQYLGVARPAVVSPVGANREVVVHGVCGLHASSEEDWVRALDVLLADVELRNRLGAEGRKRVASNYSAEVQAPRVEAILRGLSA